ncbi:MAG: hypothetical protein U1A77_23190 [Pirellulales bacterium]
MSLVNRFNPPAFMPDYQGIPGQLDAWHRAMSAWFDGVVKTEGEVVGTSPQYFNAASFDPGGVRVEQAVTWNAFPKELLRRYGREKALMLADHVFPLERYRAPTFNPLNSAGMSSLRYRPQEEYCEWRVERDPTSNKIRRITFTSEPPEYWQALFGFVAGDGGNIPDAKFPGSHEVLLRLYHELVSPEVRLEDLIASQDLFDSAGQQWATKGQYNIYNKWNTTHGIAHLCAPPNSLVAEVQLGGDATVQYLDAEGRLLVEPDALIAYAGYGGPNRNSDPTIGGSVNALARLGAYVTLKDPVGLYMDHIDLAGWEAPDGGNVSDFVHVIRGTTGMIERMVIEAPQGRRLLVGDLSIGGVPICYGGQVAECITVKLVGVAHILSSPRQVPPVKASIHSAIDSHDPRTLGRGRPLDRPLPAGTVEAFLNQGVLPATGSLAARAKPSRAKASAAAVILSATPRTTRPVHCSR